MTAEEALNLPPGTELDGAIDDFVLGIDRRANKPALRMFAIGCAVQKLSADEATAILCGEKFSILRFKGPAQAGEEYDCWIWQGRRDTIWQTALERHVSAWRLPPSRQWSLDEASTSGLYDPLAQWRRWQLSGRIDGWTVHTPEGLEVSKGPNKIVAMLRAVLVHHLRIRKDLAPAHANGSAGKIPPKGGSSTAPPVSKEKRRA